MASWMAENSTDWLQELPTAEPVFVWTPAPGCGLSWMRTLLCSSREVFLGDPDPFLLHDLPRSMRLHGQQAGHDAASADASPVPRSDLYSTALIRGFAHLCGAYAQSAHRAGFRRWGTGLPAFPSQEAAVVRGLLPRSKHVVLLRRLEDAIRERRPELADEPALRTAALEWSDAVVRALEVAELPTVHVVRFEDLVANPDDEVPRLCEFLRIASVDLGLIDDVRHGAPEAFRHELSESERELLTASAKSGLELAGYRPSPDAG